MRQGAGDRKQEARGRRQEAGSKEQGGRDVGRYAIRDTRYGRHETRFRAGQRVWHATFGEGLVIESRLDRDDELVTVMFEEAGLKRLMASIADLKRLEG